MCACVCYVKEWGRARDSEGRRERKGREAASREFAGKNRYSLPENANMRMREEGVKALAILTLVRLHFFLIHVYVSRLPPTPLRRF